MKRKHPVSFGADAHRKRAQSASKQITESSQTKDVPLTAVFARILNDVTNKNIQKVVTQEFQLQCRNLITNEVVNIIYYSYFDIQSVLYHSIHTYL